MDREITITVPEEIARKLDELVASGEYGSASEAAGATLQVALNEPDPDWELSDEDLLRAVQEADADPTAFTGAEVNAHMLALHEQQLAKAKIGK